MARYEGGARRHPFYKGVVLGSVVAVVVLMAATALSGTGIGAVFNLGKANTVNRTSSLSGATKGKMLQVTNKGSGAALGLKVKAGRPPLAVNSTARVKRLNADLVDGLHAGEPRKVFTGRRDLSDGTANEEIVTVPGLITATVGNEAGTLKLTVTTVNPDEEFWYAYPGVTVGSQAIAFYRYEVMSPDAAHEVRFIIWNRASAADLRVNVMRPAGSGQLTVFVEATVQ